MKRTCCGCRALNMGQNLIKCTLDYDQRDGKPLEECPKPLTYRQLLDSNHKRWSGKEEGEDK